MKKLVSILIAVILFWVPLSAPSAAADQWDKSGTAVLVEPSPAGIILSARDPDELPVIPAPGKQEKKRGDADGNGEINYMDALLVLRHSVGLEELSDAIVSLCDVDRNGELNYMDALLILRHSVGLEELD